MFPTASYDIYADRYVPHTDYLRVRGYDFTGAALSMQVRDRKNGGLVCATITPTLVVTTEDSVLISTITWVIPEATMEAMPLDSATPEADVTLWYDIHLTPSGGTKFIPLEGRFIVDAGVTQ